MTNTSRTRSTRNVLAASEAYRAGAVSIVAIGVGSVIDFIENRSGVSLVEPRNHEQDMDNLRDKNFW